MKVQEIKRTVQLQEWASQVSACEQSGLSVKRWCEGAGIAKKTYYYRRRRVHEELLEVMGSEAVKPADVCSVAYHAAGTQLGNTLHTGKRAPAQQAERPVFAAFSIPQSKSAAVTVWVGGYAVDIQNGADDAVVERVLKVVSRL